MNALLKIAIIIFCTLVIIFCLHMTGLILFDLIRYKFLKKRIEK